MFNQDQLHTVEASSPVTAVPQQREGDKANVDNTDIYYMPENFQKRNDVAGRNTNIKGVWVLIITIILLVMVAGAAFMYWSEPGSLSGLFGTKTTTAPLPAPVVVTPITNTVVPAVPVIPTGSPRETYLSFRGELAQATTVEAYMAVFAKYATTEAYAKIAARKMELETANTPNLFTTLRGYSLISLDGTEDISDATAEGRSILTVKKTNNREVGTVILLTENAQWRISEENWQASGAPTDPSVNQPATDDDSDGLSNLEEALIGTNAKASDTDTDTFNDLAELNNGYDPAGPGKLSDNKNLATYLNTTFNFSLQYPSAWNRTIATTDDSIMLTATDGQFVQVLIQPNSERDDILSWYKRTLSVENVPVSQQFTSVDWTGVRSPDGLTAYLTNKDKSYIFVVTYNTSTTKTLNYRNIYELILRSLKLAA